MCKRRSTVGVKLSASCCLMSNCLLSLSFSFFFFSSNRRQKSSTFLPFIPKFPRLSVCCLVTNQERMKKKTTPLWTILFFIQQNDWCSYLTWCNLYVSWVILVIKATFILVKVLNIISSNNKIWRKTLTDPDSNWKIIIINYKYNCNYSRWTEHKSTCLCSGLCFCPEGSAFSGPPAVRESRSRWAEWTSAGPTRSPVESQPWPGTGRPPGCVCTGRTDSRFITEAPETQWLMPRIWSRCDSPSKSSSETRGGPRLWPISNIPPRNLLSESISHGANAWAVFHINHFSKRLCKSMERMKTEVMSVY